MAIGFPVKDDYATGDILTAANMNDLAGTVNTVSGPVATAAGKNKIINGDFRFNQRGFTTSTTAESYGFDRFYFTYIGGTTTYSAQTFTPGSAPLAGYEAINFARLVTTSQSAAGDRAIFFQRIEDVRTFAGQTATVSFWAKADSGTPSVTIELTQGFGSGGSPSSTVNSIGTVKIPITTSWARYSATISVPSISGKTIGTTPNTSSLAVGIWVSAGSDFNTRSNTLGLQNNTFDFWGVQMETGSVATDFQTASGSIGGELALCQRYYAQIGNSLSGSADNSTTTAQVTSSFPVTMRAAPTASVISGRTCTLRQPGADFSNASPGLANTNLNSDGIWTQITGFTGLTSTAIVTSRNNAVDTHRFIALSAEL